MRIAFVPIVALGAILTVGCGVQADESAEAKLFAMAGLLYEEGKYEEAARSYEHLIGLGYDNPTIYYNLANSYYEFEDVGRASLNYLRASRLAPFDEDIRANLDFVRQQGENPTAEQASTPALVQMSQLVPWITFNGAAIIALASWLVVGLLALLYMWSEGFRRSMTVRRLAAVGLLAVVFFSALTIGKHWETQRWQQVGVVTAESTAVFRNQDETEDPRFTLKSGSEVRIIKTRGKWSKIGIFDSDVEGWIESFDIERVLEPQS